MKVNIRIISGALLIALLPACKFFWDHEERPAQSLGTGSPLILTFLGAPGSGKGTLAEQCVKELGFLSLSTGNLLREAVKAGDDLGKQANVYMKEGKLVPDGLVTNMVEKWLSRYIHEGKPIILDGFPRTARQAELLINLLKEKFPGTSFKIVELTISDQALVKRLSQRLVCSKCQRVYAPHMVKGDAVCQSCKIPLTQREDDTETVILERLKVYQQTSGPLIQFYQAAGIPLVRLPVENKSVEQVFEEFKKLFEFSDAKAQANRPPVAH